MKTEQPLRDQSETAEPAKEITLCLHDLLARLLAEQYRESLRVDDADLGIEGNVRYAFDELGFQCLAHAATLSERAGSIVVAVRLGRLYKAYPQALRWLACNRAGNSVSLHFDEKTNGNRELWVSSHRVTFPNDENGIREMLLDMRSEL